VIRDLRRLGESDYDVLVIGGGISGLTIAYDAAQRGLTVALVERGDFGAATSFNHLRTVHGGLRYLQSGDFVRMRESIRERRAFARIAPRFVAPLAFAMPTAATLTRNSVAMRAALALDAFVGHDRNDGVAQACHLPAGRVVGGLECRSLFDGALTGTASAAVWYDYQTVRPDRLMLSFAEAASRHEAVLANYVEAIALLKGGRGVQGIQAHDACTGNVFDVRAKIVVNAAGPWGSMVLDAAGVTLRWPLLKAMNLVTSRPARQAALVAPTRAGRALVLLPWQGHTLVGTSESADERQPDDQDARRCEVEAFLADVNETFPALELQSGEVSLVHRGVVPAVAVNGRLSLLGHSRVIDHAAEGAPGMISVVGVKYTTARAVAERTVDLVLRKLGRPAVPCRTAEVILPGAGLDDQDPDNPVLVAVRDEMAQTLSDVVIRRTGLGATSHPGDAVAIDVASRMETLLGWTDERREQELDALQDFYAISE